MTVLKIASNLSLPIDIVTQTVSIIAKRRAGKSYAARKITEELIRCHQQVVIVDPKGDTWGIRSSSDGKSPGLPVVILGGEHGDVPLEANSGEIVAKLVVEERVSVLLDLSFFRKSEVAQFMAIFLETLYRLKAKEQYRTPMMLVIDEADAIAPQKPYKGEERMLGAAEDIVRRGGQRGIGCLLVTQRSAVLNKNVLTQSQIIVALRTIAPQDIAALDAWIEVHGTVLQREKLLESIASLPTGTAWFWSPGWPDAEGIFKRVQVAPIETFDSGATPKPGEKRVEPKNLADVDLDALKRQMAATIEKAKADDPKELKRKIAELERERVSLQKSGAAARALPVDKAALGKYRQALREAMKFIVKIEATEFLASKELGQLSDAAKVTEAIEAAIKRAVQGIQGEIERKIEGAKREFRVMQQHAAQLRKMVDSLGDNNIEVQVNVVDKLARSVKPISGLTPGGSCIDRSATSNNGSSSKLPIGEHKILTAAIQHGSVTREQLTVLTGYKRSSRDAYISRLREKGYLEIVGDRLEPTSKGGLALPNAEPLPTGDDLRDYWMRHLPEGEKKILEVLLHAYPDAVLRDAIDDRTGYKRSSRDAYISRLSNRELVKVVGPGEIKASEILFQ